MSTLNDGVLRSLSLYSGTANERLRQVLAASIAVPFTGDRTLDELWAIYLAEQGYTTGSLQERIWAWMNSRISPDGATYNDSQYAFWNQGTSSFPPFPGALSIFNFNRKLTSLPPELTALNATYTRNSEKRVVQDGALVTLSANQFGTSYDPVTGMYGYVPEPAATNAVLYSNDYSNAVWTTGDLVTRTDGVSAPDGTTTASTFAWTFASNAYVRQIVSSSSAARSISIHFKAGNHAWFRFVLYDSGSNQVRAWFNAQTGQLGTVSSAGTGSGATALIEPIGTSGWYRLTVSGTVPSGSYIELKPQTADGSTSQTGIVNASISLWHCQAESGLRATSPIYTTGSTATRAADVLSVPLANIPGFSSAGYTLFADGRFDVQTSSERGLVSVDDATANNRAQIRQNASNLVATAVVSGGATQAANAETSVAIARYKAAYSVSANSFLRAVNGVAGTADTAGSMPVSPALLQLGKNHATDYANGFLFRVGLIPQALTQAQINGLTA